MLPPLTFPAVLAKKAGTCPQRRQPLQLRKRFAERAGAESLALFDPCGGAHRWPHPHKHGDVVGLNRQFQNRPALFAALLTNQVLAALPQRIDDPRLATLGTPDQAIDHQARMRCVALVVQGAPVVAPVDILPQYLHSGHRTSLSAQATARPFIRMGSRRSGFTGYSVSVIEERRTSLHIYPQQVVAQVEETERGPRAHPAGFVGLGSEANCCVWRPTS
jgi:hypothetical protein